MKGTYRRWRAGVLTFAQEPYEVIVSTACAAVARRLEDARKPHRSLLVL